MCLYTLHCLTVPGNADNIDQKNITVTNDTEEHQVWIRWPNPTSPNGLIVTYEIELTKVDESHVSVTVDRRVIVSVTTVWHRWCYLDCGGLCVKKTFPMLAVNSPLIGLTQHAQTDPVLSFWCCIYIQTNSEAICFYWETFLITPILFQ